MLERELKKVEEKIDDAAEKIAEKEIEAVKKSIGESAAKSTKKKSAKKKLEKLKEEQEEEKQERVKEIKKALIKEANLIKELEDLGGPIPTLQLTLTSDTSEMILNEAKELINQKINKNEAIDKLNNVLNRGTDSMKIRAGIEIMKLKLDDVKEKKFPERIKELKAITEKVVSIAQSSAQKDYKTTLLKKMEVDEVLGNVGDLSATSMKILVLDPINIPANIKKTISASILKKESTKETLDSIKKINELIKLRDIEIPVELSLFEVKKLLETGNIGDLTKAKERVSDIIPLIRSKDVKKDEDIFKDVGITKSEIAQTFKMLSTNLGPILIHEDEVITNQRLIANAINRLPSSERIMVYALHPKEYIKASTYNDGYHVIQGAVFLLEGGNIYEYSFVGKNNQIFDDDAENIRNKVFNKNVRSGMEIPLTQELMPQEIKITKSPIQGVIKIINNFFFNQVYIPSSGTYLEEGVYHYTSCDSDSDCMWPSTCNNEGVCCSVKDEGGCEIYRRLGDKE